ncbi:DUF4307 domain-containing protein [uncultured Friedmanniella sp.]|uniref:DUF4307 domain-containing protein n=1 Tax=uncultured Friedmanniella sp. TaxID=335381 RepID=UPI0035C94ED1
MTTDGASTAGAADAAVRLSRRYPPPRVSRPVLIVLVAAGSAVALGWLIWAALLHAEPVVSAQVPYYNVTSDTSIDVTITVQRSDPSIPVTCRVIAQATDFQPVAELQVPVPASAVKLADVSVKLTTLRRATSASVSGCTAD